jgi:anti-sigma B factor antagonist
MGGENRLYVMAEQAPSGHFHRKRGFMCLPIVESRGRLCDRQSSCPGVLKEVSVQLRLSTRTLDGVFVLDCDGRLVFGEESALVRDTVKNLLTQNNHIVLNLGGVNYIDSGGLGTLVALYTTARNAGGSIKLAALTQRVGDLLQVTKLLTVFDVYDKVEEAVQSFRKSAAA